MRATFLLGLLSASVCIVKAAENSYIKNCNLVSPLPGSGDESNHGRFMLISPRASEISANYDGCQTVWLMNHGVAVKVSVAEFIHGKPGKFTVFKSEKEDILFSCVYQNDKLTKSIAGRCEQELPMNILTSSLPSGCYEKIRAGELPDECEYDAQ